MLKDPVIILGMHRSGTSCLAGSLQEAGLFLGDVIVEAPHNKKGNRELKEIWTLHDRVLSENGGSWRSPPSSIIWSDETKSIQKSLIDRLRDDRPWGFKDPRTLILHQRWLDLFPNAQLVATVRHPEAVAASLMQRDKMSYADAVRLWFEYNQILLRLSSQRPLAMIEFGADTERYQQALSCIASEIGLKPLSTFHFPAQVLVHHEPRSSSSLPDDAFELYRKLRERTI